MGADAETKVVTVTLNPAIDQTVLVPRVSLGGVNRADGSHSHAGGKGLNVATCLADYGLDVVATGFLGEANDELFVAHLRQHKVRDHFLRIPGQTRVGIKIVDPVAGETTDINLPGLAPGPAALDRWLTMLDDAVENRCWVVLSGSLPPGVPVDAYATMIRRVRKKGARVALDTSGEALRLALDAGPELVKPNLAELREIDGRSLETPREVLRAARDLTRKGIRTVVVSMGAEGALCVEGGDAVLAHPPSIEVQSTVAAGDAMVAGLVAGALARLDLEARARLATAFALEVLSRPGVGIRPGGVARGKEKVRIERLGA